MSLSKTTKWVVTLLRSCVPDRPDRSQWRLAMAGALLLAVMPSISEASSLDIRLDRAPGDIKDKSSLQRGAKFFIENCLACHGATHMRYNRLVDIGFSESGLKAMLPAGTKLGATMQAVMPPDAARGAFGVAPPDLSVEARVRGTDWLYTYMRSFYLDPAMPSGVNNLVFPGVAMPNVLGSLQGEQELQLVTGTDGHPIKSLRLGKSGNLSSTEFNSTIADLVNYMDFMSEPAKLVRREMGYGVIGFLLVLLVLVYRLKKAVWKEVR